MSEKKKNIKEEFDTRAEAEKNKNEWRMEKRANTMRFVNVVALMAVFAGITLFMTFGQRPNVSYEENRDLEKPPEFSWEGYWAGEVTGQFSKYYNDTVPMRSTWKLFIADFRAHLGIKYKDGVTIVGDIPIIEKPTDTTSRPENSIPDVVIPGGNTSNKVPDVVIPGGESSSNKVPDVVIPGENSSGNGGSETAKPYNKVPEVVIPNVSE